MNYLDNYAITLIVCCYSKVSLHFYLNSFCLLLPHTCNEDHIEQVKSEPGDF